MPSPIYHRKNAQGCLDRVSGDALTTAGIPAVFGLYLEAIAEALIAIAATLEELHEWQRESRP